MMGDIPCLYYSHTLHQSAHTNTPTPSIPLNRKCTHLGIPLIFELFGGQKMNLVSTNPRDFKQQHTSVLA